MNVDRECFLFSFFFSFYLVCLIVDSVSFIFNAATRIVLLIINFGKLKYVDFDCDQITGHKNM